MKCEKKTKERKYFGRKLLNANTELFVYFICLLLFCKSKLGTSNSKRAPFFFSSSFHSGFFQLHSLNCEALQTKPNHERWTQKGKKKVFLSSQFSIISTIDLNKKKMLLLSFLWTGRRRCRRSEIDTTVEMYTKNLITTPKVYHLFIVLNAKHT